MNAAQCAAFFIKISLQAFNAAPQTSAQHEHIIHFSGGNLSRKIVTGTNSASHFYYPCAGLILPSGGENLSL